MVRVARVDPRDFKGAYLSGRGTRDSGKLVSSVRAGRREFRAAWAAQAWSNIAKVSCRRLQQGLPPWVAGNLGGQCTRKGPRSFGNGGQARRTLAILTHGRPKTLTTSAAMHAGCKILQRVARPDHGSYGGPRIRPWKRLFSPIRAVVGKFRSSYSRHCAGPKSCSMVFFPYTSPSRCQGSSPTHNMLAITFHGLRLERHVTTISVGWGVEVA